MKWKEEGKKKKGRNELESIEREIRKEFEKEDENNKEKSKRIYE